MNRVSYMCGDEPFILVVFLVLYQYIISGNQCVTIFVTIFVTTGALRAF